MEPKVQIVAFAMERPRGDRSRYRRTRRPDGAAIPDPSTDGHVPEAGQRSRRCDPSSSPLPLNPAPWHATVSLCRGS